MYFIRAWWRHQMETFSALLVLCAGNSPVNSPLKGQWRGALVSTLICAWINAWVNNRGAGDLRRHRTHYDVIVMCIMICWQTYDLYKFCILVCYSISIPFASIYIQTCSLVICLLCSTFMLSALPLIYNCFIIWITTVIMIDYYDYIDKLSTSHYLNQCWPFISEVLWHSPQTNFRAKAQACILDDELENYTFKITTASPSGQCVKAITTCQSNKWRVICSARMMLNCVLANAFLVYSHVIELNDESKLLFIYCCNNGLYII